jgi:CHAD domain-containing protein
MLKKRDQRKYLRKRCKKAIADLDHFAAGEKEKALHKFRLELKKIHAFLQFCRVCSRESVSVKYLRTIKKMFKLAGKIRDAHNFLQLAQDHLFGETTFQTRQRLYIKNRTGKFESKAGYYRKKIKKVGRSLKTRVQPINTNCIRSWYASKLNETGKALLGKGTEQLHVSRKRIKQLLYMDGLLAQSQTARIPLDIAYLDTLQEDIGQWHDLVSFIQLLKEKQAAKSVVPELTRQASKRAKSILAEGRDFWKKATLA